MRMIGQVGAVLVVCALVAFGVERAARSGGAVADRVRGHSDAQRHDSLDSAGGRPPGQISSTPARATEMGRHEKALETAFAMAIAELRARADADSQVRLALLLAMQDPRVLGGQGTDVVDKDRSRAIVAAGLADPDHAMAAWLEALQCRDAAICDPASARSRLQRIDPDNALVWLLELDALGKNGDPSRIDAVLARAAASRRHALPLQDAIALLHPAMTKVTPVMTSAQQRAMGQHAGLPGAIDQAAFVSTMTMVVAGGMQLPSYQRVIASCRPGTSMSAGRHGNCVRIFDAMAQSATLMSAMSSEPVLVSLLEPGPQQLLARERLRQLTWRRETMMQTMHDPAYLNLRMTLDEIPAFDAWQAQRNLPTTAPPAWLPSSPYTRHLVVHGTPPPRG